MPGPNSPGVPAGADSFVWSRDTNLYWRPVGLGKSKVQLTNANIGASAATNGYSFLPGGLAIQWGSATTPTSGGTAGQMEITFPIAFSDPPYTIQCTAQLTAGSALPVICIGSPAITKTSFTIQVSTPTSSSTWRGVTFYWLAIGPK